MNKQAQTYTDLGWVLGKLNNLRFQNAVTAGVLGGGGLAAAAGLLRMLRDRTAKPKEDTDDETIVLNLPAKAAESGYESMKGAKPGESKPTANGGTQLREAGKFGKKLTKEVSDAPAAVKAGEGNAGENSVATIVANTLGLTAGGLMAYDVVGRLFDRLQERRLKRRLDAAQQAYVNAMTGASKRAEAINAVLKRSEAKFGQATKEAGIGRDALDWVVDKVPGAGIPRHLMAGYILALLAGTGASAYVTKKVMDREFPEEKPKTDINRPTRIVFKTVDGQPKLAEYDGETEKEASGETCAALAAMLPIYMDVVEGRPSRTLDGPYVKLAEAMGTDASGLLKAAADSMWPVYLQILKNPRVLWDILKRTNFGFNMTQRGVANILRQYHPDVFRAVVGEMRQHAPDTYRRIADQTFGKYVPNWAQDTAVDIASGKNKPQFFTRGVMPGTAGAYYMPTRERVAPVQPSPAVAQTPAQPLPKAAESALDFSGFSSPLDAFDGGDASSVLPAVGLTAGAGGLAYALYRLVKSRRAAKEQGGQKAAEADTLLRSNYLAQALSQKEDEPATTEPPDPKAVLAKAKALLKAKRRVTVTGADANAKAYIAKNNAVIRKLLARLNAQGAL